MKKLLILAVALSSFSFGARAFAAEITDTAEITKVQNYLFELGYGDSRSLPDGVIALNTSDMIRQWQTDTGQPVTGLLTQDVYDKITTFSIPANLSWGAIGASTDGTASVIAGAKLRIVASQSVLGNCIARSANPDDCTVATAVDDGKATKGWVAALLCESDKGTAIFLAGGYSEAEAITNTLSDSKVDFKPTECKPIATIAARVGQQ